MANVRRHLDAVDRIEIHDQRDGNLVLGKLAGEQERGIRPERVPHENDRQRVLVGLVAPLDLARDRHPTGIVENDRPHTARVKLVVEGVETEREDVGEPAHQIDAAARRLGGRFRTRRERG